jgi:hypothetical protein
MSIQSRLEKLEENRPGKRRDGMCGCAVSGPIRFIQREASESAEEAPQVCEVCGGKPPVLTIELISSRGQVNEHS